MNRFVCQCGNTSRDGAHPRDCESCPDCGSKILAPGEDYDTPSDHAIVHREENGRTYIQCKRCSLIING